MNSYRTVGLLTALLLAPLASWASTPDGMTPAEEEVCDVLHDATPGLYGLCVAYCEAQDCDSIGAALSGQCQAPSPRLLEIFERKRRDGDPHMPCLETELPEPPPCRCYGVENLRGLELNACLDIEYSTFYTVALTDADELNGASVEVGNGWGVCTLVQDGAARVFEIDEAEAVACETVLRYQADDTGLVCQ